MRTDIGKLAYPVLLQGLRLRQRLLRGERLDMRVEQGMLRGLLSNTGVGLPWGAGGAVGLADSQYGGRSERYLGMRYLLACWLDELFMDTPWSDDWQERALEYELFGTRLRYDRFWDQVRLAESSPGAEDSLEAALLCVYFGFRGQKGDSPAELREWVHATKGRVRQTFGTNLPNIGEQPFAADVSMLVWPDRLKGVGRALLVTLLALVPVVTFLVMRLARS